MGGGSFTVLYQIVTRFSSSLPAPVVSTCPILASVLCYGIWPLLCGANPRGRSGSWTRYPDKSLEAWKCAQERLNDGGGFNK